MANLKALRKLSEFDRNELMERLGLKKKRSASDWIFPALFAFGAGLVVGVGLGFLVMPTLGSELPDDLRISALDSQSNVPGADDPAATKESFGRS